VPVPRANQAQIRFGRYITKDESHTAYELQSLAARHMGGGFTSRLMQELRVKRGLTYSVGAYISSQAAYGRSGITTFTKNETLVETFNVTKDVINKESIEIEEENFKHIKRFIKGNYLLGLESTSAFLETLLFFDHIGRDYKEIYQFANKIDQIKSEDMQKLIAQIFGFENQIRLVVGDKNLDKQLAKAGYKVKVLNYNDYL
jgi:zinc protease